MTRRVYSFFIYSAVLLFCFSLFLVKPFSSGSVSAQVGDAIAVRVLPNPKHYSAMDWYLNQGFKGTPTPMKVDGYDAVKDGRTVYVNVANVINACECYNESEICSCTKNNPVCTSKIKYNFTIIPESAFPSNLTADCFRGYIPNYISPGSASDNPAGMEARFVPNSYVSHCSTSIAPNIEWSSSYDTIPPDCPSCPYSSVYEMKTVSVRYTGNINLTETGKWMFGAVCDDNCELYIDGSKVMSCYQPARIPLITDDDACKGSVNLSSGSHSIVFRTANKTDDGPMSARLYWIKPSDLAAQEGAAIVTCVPNYTSCPCDGGETTKSCTTSRTPVSCSATHDVTDCTGNTIYTNVYLISYNQDADPGTLSIFDGVLSKWRFNTNLNIPGKCFNSEKETVSCLADADCESGYFCNSEKAKLVRDVIRLGNIVGIRGKIEDYGKRNGRYPTLSSGSYLPGKTISTWPSWSSALGSALGVELPVDPVNFLGKCSSDESLNAKYDKNTCWSDSDKSFADSDTIDPGLNLPPGSSAIVYESRNDGLEYNACAYMESGYLVSGEMGACNGSFNPNQAPVIDCGSLKAVAGQPFEGYITARDSDDSNVTLTVSLPESTATIFSVKNTPSAAIKQIFAASIEGGVSGTYELNATASDSHGNTVNKVCSINTQTQTFTTYPVPDQRVLVGKALDFQVYAFHSNKNYSGLTFNFSDPRFSCSYSPTLISDGRMRCDVSVTADARVLPTQVEVHASNAAGERSPSQTFYFEAYNNPPVINPLKCANKIRVSTLPSGEAPGHYNYECRVTATDPDGHTVSFPPGSITGDLSAAGLVHSNAGVISGFTSANSPGDYNIRITAVDSYGAVSDPVDLPLKIVDFCGDGVKQTLNMEGKGGPKDDGYEDCDGSDGVPTPQQSSPTWQYGCGADNCAYLNAGYCGDGVLQWTYGEQCDDGNNIDGDGCNTYNGETPSCQWECNDGTVTNEGAIHEQCDFGHDINCCASCNYTTGPTQWVEVAGGDSLASGESTSLNIPSCRGVVGGTFDATPMPYGGSASEESGPAIVFITDLSGSMFDSTYAITKEAIKESINRFYNEANAKGISIHVGTITTYSGGVHDIINIGNMNDDYGGSVKKGQLDGSVTTYGARSDQPAFMASFNQAAKMLNDYGAKAADGEKYIIFATDGWDNSPGNELTGVQAIKDSGIKIYMETFNNWTADFNNGSLNISSCSLNLCYSLQDICKWSSDNGDFNLCFKNINVDDSINASYNGYCYYVGNKTAANPPSAAVVQSRLAAINTRVVNLILTRIPSNITYAVNGVSNPLSSYKDSPFTPPNPCDISGSGCSPSVFNFSTAFTGSGEMKYNNFKLNIIPLCSE